MGAGLLGCSDSCPRSLCGEGKGSGQEEDVEALRGR